MSKIWLDDELARVKFGKKILTLRRNVIDDYWAFNSVFYARTYDKLQLRRDDILLDVGANIGLVTLYFYDKVNKILAIEPEPDNFKMLRHNVQTNNCKNVITVNKAVSDERGFTQFDHTGGGGRLQNQLNQEF